MEGNENVARLLKKVWVMGNEIAPAAFTLRPNIYETYISVLRENVSTFQIDALEIAHRRAVKYASINTRDLTGKTDILFSEKTTYSVKPIDNEKYKSHAGIFIAINGHNIVGGEPFEKYLRQKGVAEDILLISIAEQLAHLAQKSIKTIKQ